MHTHAHDAWTISPLLAATSPTPECGKTTLLTMIGALVPRPLPASNITAAALFRAVEKWRPTLVIDEADTFLRDSDELRGVINSGHNKANAFVIRTSGDDHEPKTFSTWAPKAIALIGHLPPTLDSRSIHIELRRLADGETVEPLRGDRLDQFEPLRRMAWRWAEDHFVELAEIDPAMPANLRGRAADNWRPLIAIAEVAGDDWPEKARRAAELLSAGRSEQSAGIMLLDDIRTLFSDRNADRLTSAEIVDVLGKREDRPWSEWRGDKPITTRQLARLLEPFGVRPTTIRTHAGTAKGYHHDDFADAFRRYPGAASVTPSQAKETAVLQRTASVTAADQCDGSNEPTTAENGGCDGVTDRNPERDGFRGNPNLTADDLEFLQELGGKA
jgi:putative DNA primase/helicase